MSGCALFLLSPLHASGFLAAAPLARSPRCAAVVSAESHWMDFLKFGGAPPPFDVLSKTQEYVAATASAASDRGEYLPAPETYYADDYVFRGSIVGPISRRDVAETQKSFNLLGAYPDIDRGIFGLTVDPQNPYRVFFFERWTATMTGSIKIGPLTLPPSNKRIETPIHVTSITWNPDGKVVYESISPPVDRFEGNTKGAGAVFGLLAGAGLQLPASVGDPARILAARMPSATLMHALIAQQKLNTDVFRGALGKTWSGEAEVPAWWKSTSKGAEPNDRLVHH
ncbi:hypothetical protein EMIHUDRAFT_214397 [Emiliania huxleyi CCMP1516]|uniref:DUF1254 domain-containing protein n=2 Tax=Emiliania huxleyi TaxID=2903 RepID=A0A0D3IJY5_EMIH1|nr:hypothetical protein EMIHUDRAFT_214397 [Emiliania huxleyi CCMP1516]EOD11570.1 hypothetical protein EMIHUDRAFT_214397 [Emiliania huxleyi CCMP1516]|eukprot:XP_005763999.1 hypothetical protein EMIHUDRAFT_214397 [Emiliania huxleyi CCMP1516]